MRRISILICLIVSVLAFSACGAESEKSGQAQDKPQAEGSLQIVATIFPAWDWTRVILGDNPAGAEMTQLLDSGMDLHSFQPGADDILKISDCDLFIYVGGESDEWVEDALKNAANEDMITVNLMEALGDQVREEEVKEGMEAEAEEEGDAEEAEEGPEYDEHVWLSVENARILCRAIEEAIAAADPDHTEVYAANLEAYQAQLDALDRKYQETVDEAPVKTLLFGDRFPFRYLTEEYGLDYYAAFVGCSAESEASFETIRFLAEKMDELGLTAVCTIDGSDQKIANTIIQNTRAKNQRILTLNSMQSVTSADAKAGATWCSIMEDNLDVLGEALQ